MKFLFLAVLCASVGLIHSQALHKCLEPGATLEDGQKARLCYGAEESSVVELRCNWDEDAFQFELTVRPDVDSKEIDLLRQVSGYSSQSQPAQWLPRMDRADVDTDRQACPIVSKPPRRETFNFREKAPEVDMVIRGGDLYYETSVVISEYRYIHPDCRRARFFVTDVHLSCCAKPVETPQVPFTPPLHQYCNLTVCRTTPDFSCKCLHNGEQWNITATTTADLDSFGANVGFQLSNLFAHPHEKDTPSLSFITGSKLDSLPPHLEHSHSAGGKSHTVLVNPFVFHPNHEDRVHVTCTATYCKKNPALPVSQFLDYLPDCVEAGISTYSAVGSRSS